MNFLDLFSGIGGFRLGLERNGHKPVGYVEIDKFARQSYNAMFDTSGEWTAKDITKVTDEEWREFHGKVDIIAGGFPCQAFSIAGKRLGFLDSTKGTLFFDIARAVKEIQPRYVFMENVKGLINHNQGNTLKVIINTMNELGYYVDIELINSKNFGVPQNRERVYLICTKANETTKDGLIQNLNTSMKITESYLLGLLQKNLAEAKKLQERKSKEWVLNYLILKDMVGAIQKNSSSKSTMMMIKNILLDGQKQGVSSLESMESIEELLKTISGENLSTILTSINKIMSSETCTSLKILANILNATCVLQGYYQSYWKKVLLYSTLVQENTKYAKISDYVSTEESRFDDWINGDSVKSVVIKKQDIIGHLRGDSGREVFPFFGENAATINQIGNLNNSTSFGGNPQTGRVYDVDGLSPTLNTMQGGGREPKVLVSGRVRKLTPRECWRLQAFSDELFDKAKAAGLSDSQLYKQAGNSVTVNVIEAIAKGFK